MNRITFIIFLLLISNFVQSEEIKLSCNMKRTVINSHLPDQNTNDTITVEVIDLGKDKSIIPNSDQYASVGTIKFAGVINNRDNSDKNKWDISQTYKNPNGSSMSETTIRIDRNSGNIYYTSNFVAKIESTAAIIQTTATGECEKVNTIKKKF